MKHMLPFKKNAYTGQPPSGGCVLKLLYCIKLRGSLGILSAAFGRLRVETVKPS